MKSDKHHVIRTKIIFSCVHNNHNSSSVAMNSSVTVVPSGLNCGNLCFFCILV